MNICYSEKRALGLWPHFLSAAMLRPFLIGQSVGFASTATFDFTLKKQSLKAQSG